MNKLAATVLLMVVIVAGYFVLRATEERDPSRRTEQDDRGPDKAPAPLSAAKPSVRSAELPSVESAAPDSTDNHDVRVTVLRPTGEAAAGAEVLVSRPVGPPVSSRTDSDGHATLHHMVFERDSDGACRPTRVFRASLGGEIALQSVTGTVERSIELRLEPGIVVRVHVRGERDAALRARVGMVLPSEGVSAMEVSSGVFEFPMQPESSFPVRLGVAADGYDLERLTIDAAAARASPVEVRLVPVVHVRGRLTSENGDAVTGEVQIIRPARQAYHFVQVRSRDGSTAEWRCDGEHEWFADADASGRFDVDGLRRDGGDLVVFASGYAPLRRRGLLGDHGDVDLGDVVLVAGGSVAGVIEDGDGRPVPDAVVYLQSEEVNTVIDGARSDDQGRFAFSHVGGGNHVVNVLWSEGSEDWQKRERKVEGVRATTESVHIVLVGGLTIRFFDAATREPLKVSSAMYGVVRADGGLTMGNSSQSSGDTLGSARLDPGPGTYDVSVEVPGYEKVEWKAVRVAGVRETVLDAHFREKPK